MILFADDIHHYLQKKNLTNLSKFFLLGAFVQIFTTLTSASMKNSKINNVLHYTSI